MLNSSEDIFSDKILYMSLLLKVEEKILSEEINNKLKIIVNVVPEEALRIMAYEKLFEHF